MTLQELKYVVALSKLRHFRKAAEYCHVSQPTLSVAIKKIEDELGINLFERFNNDIQVTAPGEKIVKQAQEVLLQSNEIAHIAESFKNPLSGVLKVGFIYSVGSYVYPKLLKKISELAPEMPIHIYEGYTKDLRAKLNEGVLDVGILALPFKEANIVTREVYTEPFEVLLPSDHPLAEKTTIHPSDLSDYRILTLGEGHCFGDQVKSLCPSCFNDKTNMDLYEGTSLEAVRHMVYSGMGITILPKTAAYIPDYLASTLVTRPIQGAKAKRRIALAWRMSYTRTAVIDVLLKALQLCDLSDNITYK